MPINLNQELTELRRMILGMGALVEERLALVIEALVNRNYEMAQRVRHGDREVDLMEVEIEETCLRVLALSQPVATNLRFVLAVLRINSDLERIADLAKSIAKRILDMQDAPAFHAPPSLIEMANHTRQIVSDALAALANEDTVQSRRVRRADDRIDDLQKEVFAWANSEIPRNVTATQGAIDVLSITRALERIGDHAENIAEDVIFLVEGMIVRHQES